MKNTHSSESRANKAKKQSLQSGYILSGKARTGTREDITPGFAGAPPRFVAGRGLHPRRRGRHLYGLDGFNLLDGLRGAHAQAILRFGLRISGFEG